VCGDLSLYFLFAKGRSFSDSTDEQDPTVTSTYLLAQIPDACPSGAASRCCLGRYRAVMGTPGVAGKMNAYGQLLQQVYQLETKSDTNKPKLLSQTTGALDEGRANAA